MHRLLAMRLLPTACIMIACLIFLPSRPVCAQESSDAGSITPAAPIAFEAVYLELPISCSLGWTRTYAPESYRVELVSNELRVHVQSSGMAFNPEQCGPRYSVRLGNLPQGDYTVTLHINEDTSPEAGYEFTVVDPGNGEEKAPAFDYSGFYWDPVESGSSLQVIQTGRESLGAVLLTYQSDGTQQWIVIGAGGWETPGRYVGKAWKTRNGHPIGNPPPGEPVNAEGELIGDAIIDFGGGIGIDPNNASISVFNNGEQLYHRDYRRFAF